MADAPPSAPVPDDQPPYLVASLPKDGETNVAADKVIALRFSESLQVTTADTATVTLADKDGSLPVNIVPAEEGMLIFITPKKPLSAGESYTLTVSGPTDLAGLALLKIELRFTVANDAPSSNDDEAWDAKELGNWKTKHPEHSQAEKRSFLIWVSPFTNLRCRASRISAEGSPTPQVRPRGIPEGRMAIRLI